MPALRRTLHPREGWGTFILFLVAVLFWVLVEVTRGITVKLWICLCIFRYVLIFYLVL